MAKKPPIGADIIYDGERLFACQKCVNPKKCLEVNEMNVFTLCSGPGPNKDCPQLTVNEDGSAIIGEDKKGVGLCQLDKDQFEKLKETINSL